MSENTRQQAEKSLAAIEEVTAVALREPKAADEQNSFQSDPKTHG